ncbi:MAG: baseplate wedge protein 53, partial [Anaerolineales bacterium]|nr:baseplate wedge protein 53 [Anaerolineales bacterium]
MYFDRGFPKINYDVDGDGVTILAEDILTRIIIRDKAFSTYTAFAKHFVQEHETPESIATAAYGRPTYHWVVLMFNRMFDRYYDWPLTERQLQLYANDKYDDGDDIHHYEAPQ